MSVFTETETIYNGNKYKYFRPSQMRKIRLKSSSNRGFMPSLKLHLHNLTLEYESKLERDFLLLLDHDPNCVDLQPQPVGITYKTKSGTKQTIYPDCWAYFTNGREILFEIKPEYQYRKLVEDKNWNLRNKAIQDFCKKRGWTYQVITELKINCVRLNNVKDLIISAKHYSPSKVKKEVGHFNSYLTKFLEKPHNFKSLPKILTPILPLELEEIISFLKYRIYYLDLFIDWDKPLEETNVYSKERIPLIPLYDLPENEDVLNETNIIIESEPKEKVSLKTMREQQHFQKKLNLIKPLIDKFGKEGKKSEIEKYCKENKKHFYPTYKAYLRYKKDGEEGLYPKWVKTHTKSHLNSKVETLLQDALYDYNHGKWSQITGAYEDFKRKCFAQKLKPASYETFRKRINSLPASEMRGKFKPKTQAFISRGLSGTYEDGRYSGCVIQMDHTPLDIWLVDPLTKQPIGRPHLTLGIDVFSRSIWSYFLSFNKPSRESVLHAIIRGLIPKEQLPDWKYFESQKIKEGFDPNQYTLPCAGFPNLIQVDNGMDFRANEVKDFCMKHNITLEFRPVKTPEYGGFVESAWDTINSAIRNAKLPGRIFSRLKSRKSITAPKFKEPPNYDAKKDASLTLEDFREWLFNYFVIKYSADIKASQKQSPNELWLDGMKGERFQPMGGALRTIVLNDFELFDYEAKVEVKAVLSQKGFRYENIFYSSQWLKEARKDRILIDKKRYKFRVSHWDIRKAYIKNPNTNEIEELESYNYNGDDRVLEFLKRGLGKIQGYNPFPISLNDLQLLRKNLGQTKYDEWEKSVILGEMNKKMTLKAEQNKKERKRWENLNKTKEGKIELEREIKLAQLNDDPIHANTPEEKLKIAELQEKQENEEVKPYATNWDDVKDKMTLSVFYENDKENKKEEDI